MRRMAADRAGPPSAAVANKLENVLLKVRSPSTTMQALGRERRVHFSEICDPVRVDWHPLQQKWGWSEHGAEAAHDCGAHAAGLPGVTPIRGAWKQVDHTCEPPLET